MTIEQWLNAALAKLNEASVPTARLDAEVLLADILQKDRTWLHAHPDEIIDGQNIQGASLDILDEQIFRRVRHEPLAYIRGKQEFYGRDFLVTADTLTPRPETETMVELLLSQIGEWGLETGEKLQIIDIGTGSGCIIISLALELSKINNQTSLITYLGLDISKPALKIAKQNALNLGAKVEFRHFDLAAENISTQFPNSTSTIIMANLPYVPDHYEINKAAKHEPRLALFAGKDGLDFYRELFRKATKNTRYIFTESLEFQHAELQFVADSHGYQLRETRDLIQYFSLKK